MQELFTPTNIEKGFFVDSVSANKRGQAFSLSDMFGPQVSSVYMTDSRIHDANFAFLSTALAKLHEQLYQPIYYVTYQKDIPIDTGGGFVDYVSYFTVNWAGIMNEFRNVVGNNANYIPRVNTGLNQEKVNVYTWEVAYDLRFVELEKMKKLQLQKSISEIYTNIIVAGWDLFVQKVAYLGIDGKTGLFNSDKVLIGTIDNSSATTDNTGFAGLDDSVVVSFFNGIFEEYLLQGHENVNIIPDTILVPTFVNKDLVSRFSALYTNTLYNFLLEHNLGKAEAGIDFKIRIESRPELNTLGTGNHGRIVAYKKDRTFVRLDMPYPMQHFITLPNIDKMSYTSAFVGQVSEIQLPYNTKDDELGIVTYWDFTK